MGLVPQTSPWWVQFFLVVTLLPLAIVYSIYRDLSKEWDGLVKPYSR